METQKMRRFWNRRAREDPFFFVDSRLPYGSPDTYRFWEDARGDLDNILGALEIEIQPEDSIVEIGCGVGRMTRVLAKRGGDVRALDVSERMLGLAREYNAHLRNVQWLLGDGATLAQIEDASADVCFSTLVFQHIPDPEITMLYIGEMGRVLRPGGWAAFQVSNAPDIHRKRTLRERLRGSLLAARGRGPRGQAAAPWLGSAVDLDRVQKIAASAGMATERVVGAGTLMCAVLLRRRDAS
jgi:SAM-dependent methyltransferase